QEWRHYIHAHPETAFEETATAAFVADKLASFGLEVHTGLAKTGVVAVLRCGDGADSASKAIGLRADLDALHVHERSGVPYAMRPGPLMGAYDIFEIVATGKGAHAAMAYTGKDPMLFAAQAINALQTIVARNLHPQDAGVVSVTQVHGGDTWNVIPQEVVLRGTVRSFKREVQDLIEERMRGIVAGVAATFDMAATVRYERRYPATVN